MRALLFWLTGFLPCYLINRCDSPYLERYYLGSLFSLRFYIHRFVERDPRSLFHNHGWKRGFSLVLSGFYVEERFDGTYENVMWWNLINGKDFHRTKCTSKPDVWTLFVHGGYGDQKWEFKRKGEGKMQYREYKDSAKEHKWWKFAKTGSDSARQPLTGYRPKLQG